MKYRLLIGAVLGSVVLLVVAAATRILPVTVNENGILYDPTNFFAANSNELNLAVRPGEADGVTNIGATSTVPNLGFTGGPITNGGTLTLTGLVQTAGIAASAITSNQIAVANVTPDKMSAMTSANLRNLLTDESGSGVMVAQGGSIGAGSASTVAAGDSDQSIANTLWVQGELTARTNQLTVDGVAGLPLNLLSTPFVKVARIGTNASIENLFPISTVYTNQDVTNFYVIPSGTRRLVLQAVGQGGAGGSGARRAPGVISGGGGGAGGGGACVKEFYGVDQWWTNIIIWRVAPIRQGGADVTTDNTDGNAGQAGSTRMSFYLGTEVASNILATVGSGASGGAGTSTAGGIGGAGQSVGTFGPATGGAGSTSAAGTAGLTINAGHAAAGAGGGGGVSATDVPQAGGLGGGAYPNFAQTAIPGALAGGFPGVNWNSSHPSLLTTFAVVGGWGPSGGSGSINSDGGDGANGYWWGSPGSGGGGARNGFRSGRGGHGGPSITVITAYER